MDTSACSFIITELTHGMEVAKHLNSILSSETYHEAIQALIQEIISSFNRALFIVSRGDSGGQSETPPLAPPTLSQPESSVSIDDTPCSNKKFEYQQEQKVVSKKRKAMPTCRNQMRISTDDGLEGNTDDGYSWRKYGQKDILGAKFPRSYYRCTYRYVHNCMAKKQVQRTDEDPTVFDVTYKGQHTCNAAATPLVEPPTSPEKHDSKQNNHHQLPQPPISGDMLSNLRENLSVITSDLDGMVPSSFSFLSESFEHIENYQQFYFSNETDNNDCLQGYSSSFVSPATSGSNCFTEWGNDFQHHDESNLSGKISTTTSATNSPLAFTSDLQDLSRNFSFNDPGFFI